MSKQTKITLAGIEFIVNPSAQYKGHELSTEVGSAKENSLFWIGKLTGIKAVDGKPNPSLTKLSQAQASQILDQLMNKPKQYSKAYVEQCRKVVAKTQGF